MKPLEGEEHRMDCWPLVLYLMLLLDCALSSLPAPVNVYVDSINFHHVLHWDPGPGTPLGTLYKIFKKEGKKWKSLSTSKTTSVQLNLPDAHQVYCLMVQSSFNQTLSPKTSTVCFKPYEETKIDGPKLSLAGCGTCIQINITMPEAGIDIHTFYYPKYRVIYNKRQGKEITYDSEDRSFTLNNLQSGTEYCVQVHPMISLNRNTVPSARECVFTSPVEVNRGPVIVGTVTVLLGFVLGGLMASMFCLYYTGFICKLKATLPRAPIAALSRGSILIPERTIPDQVSISPEVERQKKHQNPRTPATNGSDLEEEEDEEEDEDEEGVTVYMDRADELSSGKGSCRDSADVLENGMLAPSGGSKGLREEVPEFEVTHEQLDEDETAGAGVCLIPEEDGTGVEGNVTDEVVCHGSGSGDVNLFSLTFTALSLCEEEEQNTRDSLTDFLMLSDVEPLLPSHSGRTLSHVDSQTESADQTAVATQEHFTGTGYEGRQADTLSVCLKASDGEMMNEEEEEEEFSAYKRRK